jgi:hypothetical protein
MKKWSFYWRILKKSLQFRNIFNQKIKKKGIFHDEYFNEENNQNINEEIEKVQEINEEEILEFE